MWILPEKPLISFFFFFCCQEMESKRGRENMNACLSFSVIQIIQSAGQRWTPARNRSKRYKEEKKSSDGRLSAFTLVLFLLQRLSYMGVSHSTNKLNAATFSVDIKGFLSHVLSRHFLHRGWEEAGRRFVLTSNGGWIVAEGLHVRPLKASGAFPSAGVAIQSRYAVLPRPQQTELVGWPRVL